MGFIDKKPAGGFVRTIFMALSAAALLVSASAAPAAPQALRAEVGKPLQAAQELVGKKQYRDALAKVAEAESVGKLSSYERYIIAQMRAAAAIGAKDYPTAIAAYEVQMNSSEFPPASRVPTLETVAKLAYASKDYAAAGDAIRKYRAAGGTDSATLGLLPQALYLAGDYAGAATELKSQIGAMEKAGTTPPEQQLQLLASSALKQGSDDGYVAALEKLVLYHPSDKYWLDLILRTANKPGFSASLDLDVLRLRALTGGLSDAGHYMDAAQLALQAGYPGEAQKFVDAGYAAGVLGVGAEASRHERLKTLVSGKVAADRPTWAEGEAAAAAQAGGDALVATGMNYAGYGDYAKGAALIEQGIAKGGLKNPEQAQLHLGEAYLLAGDKVKAAKALKAVGGADGSAELARLWMIYGRTKR